MPLLEISSGSDLPLRLEKISEQTGLTFLELLQNWILQEESLINTIQQNDVPIPKQTETHPNIPDQKNPVAKRERPKTVPPEASSLRYRTMLVKRAKRLKKAGMTLKKIAETFNDEKMPTVSGAGKWYASSIANLLKSKIQKK